MRKLILVILILLVAFSNIAAASPVKYCQLESNFPICDNNNIYDGYWWHNAWIPGIPTQESQMLPNPPISVGKAVFYGPQVMEGTAKFRGLKLKGYLDGVSLLTCGDIGKSIWIKRPGYSWEGPYLVVDCAKRGDLYGIINYREEVVEVGFKTAIKWKMVSWVDMDKGKYNVKYWNIENVQVSKYPPPTLPKFEKVVMKEWFNSRVKFSTKDIDKKTCTLQYKAPEILGKLPVWRVNCEWKTIK